MTGRRSGSSYLELVAAIALLGLAIVASTTVVLRSRRIAAGMEERARAVEAVASELALVRAAAQGALAVGEHPWIGGLDAESGLPQARGRLVVAPFSESGLRRVRVELEWRGGRRLAQETLVEGEAR